MNTLYKILFGLVLASLLLSSGSPSLIGQRPGQGDSLETKYIWMQLTPDAGYSKSYNYQLFADDQYIRAFHHDAAWSSRDGRTWRKTELTNFVKNQAFLDYVKFKGALYALGTFDGNIERYTQTTQIARTSDYKIWEILSKDSNLPKRYFYHPFVFQNKIWIIGGGDAASKYSDAWVSSDAVQWTKIADNLPFGKRAGQHFVIFKDKLYMLDYDAWVSSDGLQWTVLTPKIAEGNIFGYSVEIFDNKIWLIACNRSGSFRSEVLTSTDGVIWIPRRAPWTPRGGVATCIFKNQIIMTGGKYGGLEKDGVTTKFIYSNDVWTLSKKE